MSSKIINLGSQDRFVKFIQIPPFNAYADHRVVRLGLDTIQSAADHLALSILGSIQGRASVVSLAQAENVANLISNEFHIPVTVIKELKVGDSQKDQFLETDPETHETRLKPGITEEEAYSPTELEFPLNDNEPELLRNIIAFLDEHQYISSMDRASMNPILTQLENTLMFHRGLTQTATGEQQRILCQFAEPYIDGLIDVCLEKKNAAELLGDASWVTMADPIDQQAVARAVLYGSCQGKAPTLLLESFRGINSDETGTAEVLYKMCSGSSTLEATYRQLGVGVPRLEVQRAILIEFIEEKLQQRFGQEAIPEGIDPMLVLKIRQRLFAEGYSMDMVTMGGEDYSILTIDPLRSTLDALNGNFGEIRYNSFCPAHYWTRADGTSLEGEQAQARFNEIRAEVLVSLQTEANNAARPSPVASSSSSSSSSSHH